MKKLFRISVTVLVITVVAVLSFVLWPVRYDVQELQERPGTKYWNLTTGSRIAYTFIPARERLHPHPLIYLHGGPGAGITNREVEVYTSIAAQGYDVYLYDQVGCGLSGRLKNINDYSVGRHKRDLTEIVENTGAKKVVLVGQSWGSILAGIYLAEHPEKIAKLIITAPAPLQPANKALENIRAPDSLQLRAPNHLKRKRKPGDMSMRSKIMYYMARKFSMKLVPDKEADAFATFQTNVLNLEMVCDTQNAVIAEGTEGMYVQYMTSKSLGKLKDQRGILSTLNTPVLIMKAQCDNQPWGYTKEYLDVFRNHEFRLISNAGHNIFLEQPEEYAKTIVDFLKR
jgi:proline iminopeptidase